MKIKQFKCFILALAGCAGYIIFLYSYDKIIENRVLSIFMALIAFGLTAYGSLGYFYYYFLSHDVKKVKVRRIKNE